MTLHPIISALRKHKAGVVLIALQIALTLAIVCNAIFIIGQRVHTMSQPTGLDESDLFIASQLWVGVPTSDSPADVARLDALQKEDLAALRKMPDVVSVTPTNSLPLFSSSWTGSAGIKPGNGEYDGFSKGTALLAYYFTDEQALSTLGVKLVEGRFFRADEVINIGSQEPRRPDVIVITAALAKQLFPGESALGKPLYLDGGTAPIRVIGIVDRLQAPSSVRRYAWNSALIPARLDSRFSRYVIRVRLGRLAAAMKAVPGVLYGVNPMRVLDDENIQSFSQIRSRAYESDMGMAGVMAFVCLILLGVTAAGIVGLTSFWVSQRNRQIGVRRALGARRIDILRYFQMENLVIASSGAMLGIVMAVTLNFVLMRFFDMDRLPMAWVWIAVGVVLVLSQAAVYVPARRASRISPLAATRA
jgi:putative ABC transport system permease protein